ncbi:MAG: hypothetical protein IJ823_02730 [Bacteroidales bacterium]|nr:hypothetical protein [Bacteroidales bacterium]MBR1894152.1 hypothetical protein [Bacteroidales bacterium]
MRTSHLFKLATLTAFFFAFLSCTKGVEHTGDQSGNLYGNWVLDTKSVTIGDNTPAVTDFSGAHFYLGFMEPKLAFGKEGSIFTFDIDDVDAVPFSYNAGKKQITFEKIISLSTGFPPKVMWLFGTYDVVELTDKKLVLSQTVSSLLDSDTRETTEYTYHKLVEHSN